MSNNRTVEHFDLYVSMGFKVIPLYAKSKIPIGRNWNKDWNKDSCRKILEDAPDNNMGILLGDFVDVEADTQESNILLEQLIGDYPHPMYRSTRSIHHLFKNPDPLLTATKIYGIEFRGNRHQSVLPPSIHETGERYYWLKASTFPIPSMPDDLLEFYFRNFKQSLTRKVCKPRLKKGHSHTTCNVCGYRKFIHKKRLALEVQAFKEHGLKWQCHECRKLDLRAECRYIRKSTR